MSDLAIEVKGLRKSYGSLEAVRGVDLAVERGQVFALLGPNGAGKTTTVEILEGHRQRSAGEVQVLGFDPAKGQRAFKEKIGIVLQETGVNRFLTVAETIEQFRGFYPNPLPLDEIIAVVELQEKRDVLVRKLSGGQQRRIDVAAGLAGNPELLFLDEPTTGFDPSARRNAWKMVNNLRDLGKTILLTTHYMDEAQHLADHVAIINKGVIVAEGPPDSLGSLEENKTKIVFIPPAGASLPTDIASDAVAVGASVEITTTDPVRTLNTLTQWALQNNVELDGLTVNQASLEDVYLELTDEEAPV
ncbi:MAG TPA: ABC transporter ATP-binding protein [Actinomycetota bacterium]|nr:ABC transporter ATP-binding protein [Actinomycetota bacterium]